jgi:DNA-binding beta-propeller fold protein YncE
MKKPLLVLALLVAGGISYCAASAKTLTSTFLFSFGSSGSGNGQFQFPQAMAINRSTGRIYVSDTNNDRVQIFDSAGNYLGKWGSSGSGNGQFSGPSGIAINQATGDVYVADYGNNRIQRFDANGVYLSKWGTMGSGNGQFQSPNGLAIDPATGNVYVGEFSGDRVQYFTSAGAFLGKWGSSAIFSSPVALAIDPATSDVFVANYNGAEVQRFSASGVLVKSLTTKAGGQPFSQPAGVGVDDAGLLFISDRVAPISIFDTAGTLLGGFGAIGTGAGQFQSTYGVATGANGLVLVSDSALNIVTAWKVEYVNLPPTVTISGKARVRKTTRPSFRLRGTASDSDSTISAVRVKVGRVTKLAVGTTSWSARIRLKPGRNRVLVTATDSEGGTSASAKLVIKRH